MEKKLQFKQFDIHLYLDKKRFDITIIDFYGATGFSMLFYDKGWYKQILPKVEINVKDDYGYSLLFDWLIFRYFTSIH
jgi:hypothetical protein